MKHVTCPYCEKLTRPDIGHCDWCLKNLPQSLIIEGMKSEWTAGSKEWHSERSQFGREVVCKCGGNNRAEASVGNDAGAPEIAGSNPAALNPRNKHGLSEPMDLSEIEDRDCDGCMALQLSNLILRQDVLRIFAENNRLKKRIAQLLKHRGHVAADAVMDKMEEDISSANAEVRDRHHQGGTDNTESADGGGSLD